jgi:hypothetical protein
MKIGDLVELSAYGKRLKDHAHVRGKLGLVIEKHHSYGWWRVQWVGSPLRIIHSRKDLKIAKRRG